MFDVKKLAKEMTAICLTQSYKLQEHLNTPLGKTLLTITTGIIVVAASGDSDLERCTGPGANCWEM